MFFFFFSSRRRHTRLTCDWSSDVCSSDLLSCTSFRGELIGETTCNQPGLRSAHLLGCWRNGCKRPVLKHGPRSLTSMRVFGCHARTRNESERRWEPFGVHHRPILMSSDGFE